VQGTRRTGLSPEDVARYPRPGMAIPGKIAYSPDSRLLTYLYSEAGDLARELWQLELSTGRRQRLLEPVEQRAFSREEQLRRERTRTLEVGVTDYAWAENAPVLLAPIGGDLYRWQDGSFDRIASGGVIDPKISPDGSRVYFVRDGEVWRGDSQLTSGASPGVTNGLAEFVAQEELGRASGFWPSPDGAHLAFEEVDERNVPVYPIVHQGLAAVEIEEHRYPFPGAANVKVRLGLDKKFLELPHEDGYIARVDWHPDGRLFVQWLRRDWQRLELIAYDPSSGSSQRLLVEEQTPWINLHDDLRFIPATGEFVWSSEKTGFRHLYLHASEGSMVRQLTHGDWPAESTVALDGERRFVYFQGWRRTPVERHLFRVSLDGGEPEQLTTEPGMHSTHVAPDFSSFVDTHSNRGAPPRVTVKAMDGRVLHTLHEPARVDLDLTPPELHTFEVDGTQLHAAVYRPRATGKSPLVVMVYGGPVAQTVTDSWDMTVDLRAQMLTEHGFVVLKVDNRGSARRGLSFESHIARRMGVIEVADQVAGVRWLEGLGIADSTRVGVTGWSYGGYMTLMSLLKAPDVFKAGVAGAPVTDWDGYDTAYTEKYMSTPVANPDGYRDASALSFVEALRGDLLVVHGMIDENVHFRHTARLIQRLIDAGKPYETLIYPNERHMPRSEKDRADMERRLLAFFERALR